MTANTNISNNFMHNISRIQNQSIVANPRVRPAILKILTSIAIC